MKKREIDYSDLSDEDLVVEITNANQELYVHIVERYQAPLVRYARTLVYDEDAAADVAQIAFIKAFQNLRSFKTDKKFSSWLYRIAHNEAINHIKKYKREFRPDDEHWFDGLVDDRDGADVLFDNETLRESLSRFLSRLPIKYSEPIILHVYEQKSYQEIGEILRLPTATVGTRINRAKTKLKEMIENSTEKEI